MVDVGEDVVEDPGGRRLEVMPEAPAVVASGEVDELEVTKPDGEEAEDTVVSACPAEAAEVSAGMSSEATVVVVFPPHPAADDAMREGRARLRGPRPMTSADWPLPPTASMPR